MSVTRELTGAASETVSFERMNTSPDGFSWHVERASAALVEGRTESLLDHVQRAEQLLDPHDVRAHMRVASLLQAAFRFSGQPELFTRALAACAAVGDRTESPEFAIPARALAGNVCMLAGRLYQTVEYCEAALALADACGLADERSAAMGHQFRGYVLLEWNRVEEARDALQRAWALSLETDHGVRSGVARMLAEVALASGDHAAAAEWGAALARVVSEPMTLRNREWLAAVRAQQGFAVTRDLRELDAWQRRHDYRIETLESLSDAAVTARLHELDHLLTMLEATSQWATLARLTAVIERGARPLRVGFLIRALCARAVSLEAGGRHREALDVWHRALSEGEIGGYVRVYTNGSPLRRRLLHAASDDANIAGNGRHANRVLAASEATSPVAATPLTERQHAVLRLVAQGMSDREISAHTGLSVATIKTHLRAVYARLGARSRTAAVARARVSGLLA